MSASSMKTIKNRIKSNKLDYADNKSHGACCRVKMRKASEGIERSKPYF